jgi:hypothetical protein
LFLLPGLLGSLALAATFAWPLGLGDLFAPPVEVIASAPDGPLALAPSTMPDFSVVPPIQFDAPGIQQPPALPASEAALDDADPVIGVTAAGHSRAYSVPSLSRGPASHIVNDVLGGVPVTVTRCDATGCTRVFTAEAGGQALKLAQGGFQGGMVLKLAGRSYRQDTGAPVDGGGGAGLPYRRLPAEETTWGEWRRSHPGTDLSVPQDVPESPRPSEPHSATHLAAGTRLAAALDLVPFAAASALPLLFAFGCFRVNTFLRSRRASRCQPVLLGGVPPEVTR